MKHHTPGPLRNLQVSELYISKWKSKFHETLDANLLACAYTFSQMTTRLTNQALDIFSTSFRHLGLCPVEWNGKTKQFVYHPLSRKLLRWGVMTFILVPLTGLIPSLVLLSAHLFGSVTLSLLKLLILGATLVIALFTIIAEIVQLLFVECALIGLANLMRLEKRVKSGKSL